VKYGYARVSTDGQSLDAQVKQLRAAGAEKMFKETASGAKPTACNCAVPSITLARATC
jgi:DNA invertase Pin-like site-specific DNA recombinase